MPGTPIIVTAPSAPATVGGIQVTWSNAGVLLVAAGILMGFVYKVWDTATVANGAASDVKELKVKMETAHDSIIRFEDQIPALKSMTINPPSGRKNN